MLRDVAVDGGVEMWCDRFAWQSVEADNEPADVLSGCFGVGGRGVDLGPIARGKYDCLAYPALEVRQREGCLFFGK